MIASTSVFGTESFLEGVSIKEIDASDFEIDDVSLDRVLLEGVTMNQIKIKDFKTVDTLFSKCSLAGTEFEIAYFSRTKFLSSRIQGAQLAQCRIKDCFVISSKLNDSNLRFSKLKNVLFDSCDMRGIDFMGAELKNVVFKNCDLSGAQFSQAKLEQVDVAGSTITDIIISCGGSTSAARWARG